MQRIHLNRASGVPVFRQIIDQIIFMIEAGELRDGDRLPSSRLLAANLHINRNTTARAYTELHKRGYVSSQGRAGMIVQRADQARQRVAKHEAAVAVLADAVRTCIDQGLTADEIASIAYHQVLHAQRTEINVIFVECNEERAKAFATELSDAVNAVVTPIVLSGMDGSDLVGSDLVVTTFFHHTELRRRMREMQLAETPEVLAIVAAPHVKTLTALARIPKNRRIGILYSTEDQAEAIRESLADTGLENVTILHSVEDPAVAECDVIIIPSENPDLGQQIGDRAKVVEFGNVLDAASRRMVSEAVDDIRELREELLA